MSWTSAVADLRMLLSDGPTDKLNWRKRVNPATDGVTTTFKTFEFRRVTNFTTAIAPLGVYVNGLRQDASVFSGDNLDTGDFTFSAAPTGGDELQASYYIQWFNDPELDTFLRTAMNWLGLGDDFVTLTQGLRPSAKKWAAGEAYQKMAARYSLSLADTYKVQDQKSPETDPTVSSFWQMAERCRAEARELRDDFYTRQGQSLAPLQNTISGRVRTRQTKN